MFTEIEHFKENIKKKKEKIKELKGEMITLK